MLLFSDNCQLSFYLYSEKLDYLRTYLRKFYYLPVEFTFFKLTVITHERKSYLYVLGKLI